MGPLSSNTLIELGYIGERLLKRSIPREVVIDPLETTRRAPIRYEIIKRVDDIVRHSR